VAVGVARQDADALAAAHTPLAQRAGEAADPVSLLAPGVHSSTEDGRDGVGRLLHGAVQPLRQVHGHGDSLIALPGTALPSALVQRMRGTHAISPRGAVMSLSGSASC